MAGDDLESESDGDSDDEPILPQPGATATRVPADESGTDSEYSGPLFPSARWPPDGRSRQSAPGTPSAALPLQQMPRARPGEVWPGFLLRADSRLQANSRPRAAGRPFRRFFLFETARDRRCGLLPPKRTRRSWRERFGQGASEEESASEEEDQSAGEKQTDGTRTPSEWSGGSDGGRGDEPAVLLLTRATRRQLGACDVRFTEDGADGGGGGGEGEGERTVSPSPLPQRLPQPQYLPQPKQYLPQPQPQQQTPPLKSQPKSQPQPQPQLQPPLQPHLQQQPPPQPQHLPQPQPQWRAQDVAVAWAAGTGAADAGAEGAGPQLQPPVFQPQPQPQPKPQLQPQFQSQAQAQPQPQPRPQPQSQPQPLSQSQPPVFQPQPLAQSQPPPRPQPSRAGASLDGAGGGGVGGGGGGRVVLLQHPHRKKATFVANGGGGGKPAVSGGKPVSVLAARAPAVGGSGGGDDCKDNRQRGPADADANAGSNADSPMSPMASPVSVAWNRAAEDADGDMLMALPNDGGAGASADEDELGLRAYKRSPSPAPASQRPPLRLRLELQAVRDALALTAPPAAGARPARHHFFCHVCEDEHAQLCLPRPLRCAHCPRIFCRGCLREAFFPAPAARVEALCAEAAATGIFWRCFVCAGSCACCDPSFGAQAADEGALLGCSQADDFEATAHALHQAAGWLARDDGYDGDGGWLARDDELPSPPRRGQLGSSLDERARARAGGRAPAAAPVARGVLRGAGAHDPPPPALSWGERERLRAVAEAKRARKTKRAEERRLAAKSGLTGLVWPARAAAPPFVGWSGAQPRERPRAPARAKDAAGGKGRVERLAQRIPRPTGDGRASPIRAAFATAAAAGAAMNAGGSGSQARLLHQFQKYLMYILTPPPPTPPPTPQAIDLSPGAPLSRRERRKAAWPPQRSREEQDDNDSDLLNAWLANDGEEGGDGAPNSEPHPPRPKPPRRPDADRTLRAAWKAAVRAGGAAEGAMAWQGMLAPAFARLAEARRPFPRAMPENI
ncbi:hypothetical protein T492DRAFT_843166 [Pavlovales sp. CCMP2436]|nr:hypothetical protein T492DRAFT_843166 [Pavlovales sp. CCMP2436]